MVPGRPRRGCAARASTRRRSKAAGGARAPRRARVVAGARGVRVRALRVAAGQSGRGSGGRGRRGRGTNLVGCGARHFPHRRRAAVSPPARPLPPRWPRRRPTSPLSAAPPAAQRRPACTGCPPGSAPSCVSPAGPSPAAAPLACRRRFAARSPRGSPCSASVSGWRACRRLLAASGRGQGCRRRRRAPERPIRRSRRRGGGAAAGRAAAPPPAAGRALQPSPASRHDEAGRGAAGARAATAAETDAAGAPAAGPRSALRRQTPLHRRRQQQRPWRSRRSRWPTRSWTWMATR